MVMLAKGAELAGANFCITGCVLEGGRSVAGRAGRPVNTGSPYLRKLFKTLKISGDSVPLHRGRVDASLPASGIANRDPAGEFPDHRWLAASGLAKGEAFVLPERSVTVSVPALRHGTAAATSCGSSSAAACSGTDPSCIGADAPARA